MIKTAIENEQNLIVEGCYIPFDWRDSFDAAYLAHIRYFCLVMSEAYIRRHFADIRSYASVIERRGDDEDCTMESVLEDNREVAEQCRLHGLPCVWIEDTYCVNLSLD